MRANDQGRAFAQILYEFAQVGYDIIHGERISAEQPTQAPHGLDHLRLAIIACCVIRIRLVGLLFIRRGATDLASENKGQHRNGAPLQVDCCH